MHAPADHTEIAGRIRRARDAVRSGQPIPPADAPWMVNFLDRVLAGADLGEAVGIPAAPGQRSWQSRLRDDERDWLIRKLAVDFYPSVRPSPAAEEISREWCRYQATAAAARECALAGCPARYVGTAREIIWRLAKLEGCVALSAERIRKILVTSSPYS